MGGRKITLRTIQNYLLSLEHFVSFLLEYPKVNQSISRRALLKFQKDVCKMTKAIGRQAKRKVWQRLQKERLLKPTPLEIKIYRDSNLRKAMITDIISFPRPDTTKYDPSTYVKILGFLGLEISLDNANRPGEIMNMTVEDFEHRLENDRNIKLLEILPHKTLLSQGPAYISLTLELEKLLLNYLNKVRPTVERNDSTNFFFLNSVGSQIHPGALTVYINKLWSSFQFNSKFTNTLLRKTAVTQVHKYRSHYQTLLSSRMNHRAETAARAYFLDDKINTCFRIGEELRSIMEETHTARMETVLEEPTDISDITNGKGCQQNLKKASIRIIKTYHLNKSLKYYS